MIIEMKDIYKSFGKNDVLKGVDFNLGQGEIHALVG
ncbi:MAG: ABC transporter, partial [Anaerococcus sp.]|nr:ABC transporter [Anaerococcus sp.]